MSLFDKVDETSPSDTDYITTSTAGSVAELQLGSVTDPGVDTLHSIKLRASGSGSLQVDLVQGSGALLTIWTSKTRTMQPQAPVGIDWGNPSARSLSVAVSGAYPGVNLVYGRGVVAHNGVQRVATKHGAGLTWDSTANIGVQVGPGSLLPGSAGNYTSGMTLIVLANPAASTTRTLPFSMSSGAQPAVYMGFNADKALTATSGMLMVQTHGNNGAQAASVIDGNWHVFAVVFPEGSVLPLLYVDGIDVTASSSGSASTYANAAANVYVGGYSASGFSATGYAIPLALGFNRGIPAGEMADISRKLWQLFAPERRPRHIPAAKPIASRTIPLIATPTDYRRELLPAEAALITNYADLRVRFRGV